MYAHPEHGRSGHRRPLPRRRRRRARRCAGAVDHRGTDQGDPGGGRLSLRTAERHGEHHQASLADALFEHGGEPIIEARQHINRPDEIHPWIAQKAHRTQSIGHFAKRREQRMLDAHIAQRAPTIGQAVGQSTHTHRQQRQVVAALGREARKTLLPMQAGDVPATWADATLIESLTGPLPRTDIAEGVRRFVAWYRDYYRV